MAHLSLPISPLHPACMRAHDPLVNTYYQPELCAMPPPSKRAKAGRANYEKGVRDRSEEAARQKHEEDLRVKAKAHSKQLQEGIGHSHPVAKEVYQRALLFFYEEVTEKPPRDDYLYEQLFDSVGRKMHLTLDTFREARWNFEREGVHGMLAELPSDGTRRTRHDAD